jgi:glucokinase-like ROK family protein
VLETRRPAQPRLLKDLNLALIVDLVRRERVLSRAAVARLSGLSKVTASALIDDLVQAGLLRERGAGQSNGGRPPQLLEYQPEARLAIGAEFAHDEVVGVVTDLDARPLRKLCRPVAQASAERVLVVVGDVVDELRMEFPPASVLGLGFASPGLVDVTAGVVDLAVDVGWRDVPAARIVSERLGLPVTVANRSKAAALAERWFGPPTGAENLIYVFVGSGIAAGIVLGDDLLLGATSSAGELGHVTVEPSGPLCECGNRGCLHVYASDSAIAQRARELARVVPDGPLSESAHGDVRSITADAVIEAALSGDQLAVQVLEEAATAIGIALANVVNLFNPDAIIVGGPTSRAGQLLVNRVEREIRGRALTVPGRHVSVALSRLGGEAAAIGGAILVLRQASRLIFRRGDGLMVDKHVGGTANG